MKMLGYSLSIKINLPLIHIMLKKTLTKILKFLNWLKQNIKKKNLQNHLLKKTNLPRKNKEKTFEKRKKNDLILPILAMVAPKPFDDKDFIFEIKWDGYRAIADLRDKDEPLFYSRNGKIG